MPQERTSQYPFPTAEEVAGTPGGREIKAARNVMARHIPGIPRRPYLMGESDSAPVVRGVLDLTTACYKVLDCISPGEGNMESEVLDELKAILEDHGCLPATAEGEDA